MKSVFISSFLLSIIKISETKLYSYLYSSFQFDLKLFSFVVDAIENHRSSTPVSFLLKPLIHILNAVVRVPVLVASNKALALQSLLLLALFHFSSDPFDAQHAEICAAIHIIHF